MPRVPTLPRVSIMPQVPAMPRVPTMSQVSNMPRIPTMPRVPTMSRIPTMPRVPIMSRVSTRDGHRNEKCDPESDPRITEHFGSFPESFRRQSDRILHVPEFCRIGTSAFRILWFRNKPLSEFRKIGTEPDFPGILSEPFRNISVHLFCIFLYITVTSYSFCVKGCCKVHQTLHLPIILAIHEPHSCLCGLFCFAQTVSPHNW